MSHQCGVLLLPVGLAAHLQVASSSMRDSSSVWHCATIPCQSSACWMFSRQLRSMSAGIVYRRPPVCCMRLRTEVDFQYQDSATNCAEYIFEQALATLDVPLLTTASDRLLGAPSARVNRCLRRMCGSRLHDARVSGVPDFIMACARGPYLKVSTLVCFLVESGVRSGLSLKDPPKLGAALGTCTWCVHMVCALFFCSGLAGAETPESRMIRRIGFCGESVRVRGCAGPDRMLWRLLHNPHPQQKVCSRRGARVTRSPKRAGSKRA